MWKGRCEGGEVFGGKYEIIFFLINKYNCLDFFYVCLFGNILVIYFEFWDIRLMFIL